MSFTQVSISELQPTEPLSFDEWLDFAKRGQAKGKRDCTPGKSYPCKSICLTSSKNCRNPLEGQAKTYADWLKSGGEKVQATKVETSLAKKRRESKEARAKTPDKENADINPGDYKSLIDAGRKFAAQFNFSFTPPSNREKKLLAKRELLRAKRKGNLSAEEDRKNDYRIQQLELQIIDLEGDRRIQDVPTFRDLADKLKEYHGVTEQEIDEVISKTKIDPDITPATTEFLKEFYRVTGLKGSGTISELGIDRKDPRAYADKDRKYINVGDGSKRAMFHEAMHHGEYESTELANSARDWVESRASSPLVESLWKITGDTSYDPTEFALPDKFADPYVGKLYGPRGTPTEVYSIGVEAFASPRALRDFYGADPEHFNLVLGALLIKSKKR